MSSSANDTKMTPRKRHDENDNAGVGATKKARGGGGGRGNNNNNNYSNNRGRGGGRGRGRGRGRSGNRNNNNNYNRRNHNTNTANNNGDEGMDNMEVETKEEKATATEMEMPAETSTAVSASNNEGRNRHQFSDTTFASQNAISANSKRALTDVLKYEYMTKVQEATLPSIMEGRDVVAKAKTGSGKTTAFLLPVIERLAQSNESNKNSNNNMVSYVVLSPTRELANQIAAEFQKLAEFHPQMKSQSITMIGGTNIDKDKRRLERDSNIRVLIATPGRLLDHLTNNTARLVERLKQVDILCLDEADRLLDCGFRNEIEKIMDYMPHGNTTERQTLLFSATFPDALKDITRLAMRKDYEFIDTLDEDEGDTNVQVVQKSLVTPMQYHMIAMEHILQDHITSRQAANQAYKIIVFFTTARVAGFMAELFRADPRYPHYNANTLLEMHSRKSQSYRTTVAKKFTTQSNVVLFSSDVSARGVDYPDVTCVLQVGAPSEKAQYIHRLGRTARAGMAGVGILLLSDFEKVFLNDLDDLDIQTITDLESTLTDEEAQKEREHFQQLLSRDEGLENSAKAAYQAFLGYYNSNVRRFRINGKEELVSIANEYATIIGFPESKPPALQAKTVGKMGLQGVPGITLEGGNSNFGSNRNGGRGGRGGRGRGRSGGRGGRGGGRRN